MGTLDGKVAFVTGCARMKGIGRGCAVALATAGADVAISDIETTGTRNLIDAASEETADGWKGLPEVVAEIEKLGRRAFAVTGDVGRSADAERMVKEVLDHFGRIDILVNNAGAPQGLDRTWTWEVPEDAFDLQIRVNLKGTFLMSGAVTRHFIARGGPGRIINISSGSGKLGVPKRAAYSASKFGILGLTQVMAQELAPRGITVNAVCPGPIATARNASTNARAGTGDETDEVRKRASGTPVGRLGQAADIARTVLFLAEPSADFITGQAMGVNGGGHMS